MRGRCQGACTRQVAKEVPECRHAPAQFVKLCFGNDQHVHRGAGANGRVSRPVGKQCHFSEILAATQGRDEFLLVFVLAVNLALAFLYDIDTVTQVALPKNAIAGLEMLLPDVRFDGDCDLRQLGWKQQMKKPVRGYTDLAIETRHLHQVDAAPHQPCQQSRDPDAEHLCDGSAMPKRAEGTETFE